MGNLLGATEWLRGQGHAVKSQWNAAKGAIDLMQVNRAVLSVYPFRIDGSGCDVFRVFKKMSIVLPGLMRAQNLHCLL